VLQLGPLNLDEREGIYKRQDCFQALLLYCVVLILRRDVMYDEMTRRTPLRQAANIVEDGELIVAVNIDTDFIGGGWMG
jgi:hypothetical protein